MIYFVIGVDYKNLKKIGISLIAFYLSYVSYMLPYKLLFKIPIHSLLLDFIKIPFK